MFVALKTEKRDGHDFLPVAAQAAAAAALVSQPRADVAIPQLVVRDPLAAFQAIAREHRRAFQRPVIGISGSAGKTSTKDLLALLLGGVSCGVTATEENAVREPHSDFALETPRRVEVGATLTGRVLATEGNLNNHLGVPLTLTRIDADRHEFAVIEAGISAPGEMGMLAAMIEPDLSLITLIAAAHTAELGGLDGVAREKARLSKATRPGGLALFSRETAGYSAFRELGVPTLVVGRVEAEPTSIPFGAVTYVLTQRAMETAVSVALPEQRPLPFTFRRVSDGMAQNAVLAIVASLQLGVSADLIQRRLREWKPAKLRGEIRRDGGRLLYLDCYNANPAAMLDALQVFRAIAPEDQPRLLVLGCMEELGPDAPTYHRQLGERLGLRSGDQAFVIGTWAEDVHAGARSAGVAVGQVQVAESAAAITAVVAAWGGSVFVKGSRRYRLETVLEGREPAGASC